MYRFVFGILGGVMACQSCQRCAPQLPDVDTQTQDTQDSDTGETADSPVDTDTGPPPACGFPELEPNNSPAVANPLEMEAWACGSFELPYDFDMFQVQVPYDGWLKVDVDAVDRGSPSSPYLYIESGEGLAAGMDVGSLSSDPYMVVPIPEADTYTVSVNDSYNGYGLDYEYQLLVSLTKAPLSWDLNMEPGSSIDDPMQIEVGERVYGVVDSKFTVQWFEIQVPEDEKQELELRVLAYDHGSPLRSLMAIYKRVDGALPEEADYEITGDPYSASRDPKLHVHDTGNSSWVVGVKARDTSAAGPLYWFAFEAVVLQEQ